MASKVKPTLKRFHTVTPFLFISGAASAIEFYKKAFGATELLREVEPSGTLSHAQIRIGDSPVMISDPTSEHTAEYAAKGWARDPRSLGGSPVHLHVYVADVDAVFRRAVAAGAKVREELQDKDWGDRMGGVEDPFGHVWYIATPKKDLPPGRREKHPAASGR